MLTGSYAYKPKPKESHHSGETNTQKKSHPEAYPIYDDSQVSPEVRYRWQVRAGRVSEYAHLLSNQNNFFYEGKKPFFSHTTWYA